MDKRIKDLWVRALRSGEFKQVRGRLEKNGHYCALGVLSVLALIEGQCTYDLDESGGRFDNKRFSLSYNTCAWAKISEATTGLVRVRYRNRWTTIADLNDQGMTFSQIARIIEREWRTF